MKTLSILLRNCRYVVMSFKPLKIREEIDIVLDKNRVVCLGICRDYRTDEVIECNNSIAMPALASAHTHIQLDNNINNIKEYFKTILQLLISNGIGAIQFTGKYHHIVIESAREIGLRIATGPIVRDTKDLNNLGKTIVGNELFRPIVNIPSPDIDKEIFINIIDFCRRNSIDIYLSVSENINEVFEFKKRKGVFPIEYLAKNSLLTSHIVLLHLNWITSWEIEILNNNKSRVVICPYPDSFIKTKGLPPPNLIFANNILTGVGLDNIEKIWNLDIRTALITTLALYKNSYKDIQLSIPMLLHIHSTVNYKILRFNNNIIEIGETPDIAIISIDKLKQHLISLKRKDVLKDIDITDLILTSPISTMIINGKIVWSSETMAKLN